MSVSTMASLGSRTSGDPAPNPPYLAAEADLGRKVAASVAVEMDWRNWRRVLSVFALSAMKRGDADCCLVTAGTNAAADERKRENVTVANFIFDVVFSARS